MNTLPEPADNLIRPGSAEAFHVAALVAVRQSRAAKARGDRHRELAWLKFAEAVTALYIAERRLP